MPMMDEDEIRQRLQELEQLRDKLTNLEDFRLDPSTTPQQFNKWLQDAKWRARTLPTIVARIDEIGLILHENG